MSLEQYSFDQYALVADVTGRADSLNEAIKAFPDAQFISIGDSIGGQDTRRTIDTLMGIGAICLWGNHEWIVSAAFAAQDKDIRQDMAVTFHDKVFKNIYPSYDIFLPDRPGNKMAEHALARLQMAMEKARHDIFFEDLRMYYETEDFLAIHAGVLPNKPWDSTEPQMSQKHSLDLLSKEIETREIDWTLEPIQIFDPKHSLAKSTETPSHLRSKQTGRAKTLITGHSPMRLVAEQRITSKGRRVRLDAPKTRDYPLYAYDTARKVVVPVHAKA